MIEARRNEAVSKLLRKHAKSCGVWGVQRADEIEKLDGLKTSGSIIDQEFTRLRAKLVA
jgi:hypothetical protein